MPTIVNLRQQEYDDHRDVRALRRAVFEDKLIGSMAALAGAELALQQASDARVAAERVAGLGHGQIVATSAQDNLLGPDTTGLEVKVALKMASVPTALVHLFDASTRPLVEFEIRNTTARTRRLRLITYVEGYSARAVETIEYEQHKPQKTPQLPTFFPDRLEGVTELTRASVNIEVQDLDAETEVHRTVPVWLLARTSAPLQVQDPSTGTWIDMTSYLGAFVTPNTPEVMRYLRVAAQMHPLKRLVGYQVGEPEVESQVKAVYDALATSGMRYVNSVIEFTPETSARNQRVRLPRESLSNTSANCIDGTVLMASLLEAISLNPAIVIIPGHAFLAWETWRDKDTWRYIETTMIPTDPFEKSCLSAEATVLAWQQANPSGGALKRMPLRELRAQGITPLE